MSERTQELLHIVDMLPETEQNFISEMIKRVVIAWDPDFTKLTPEETELLRQADEELQRGETFSENDINWN
jgi:hypothetical protein